MKRLTLWLGVALLCAGIHAYARADGRIDDPKAVPVGAPVAELNAFLLDRTGYTVQKADWSVHEDPDIDIYRIPNDGMITVLGESADDIEVYVRDGYATFVSFSFTRARYDWNAEPTFVTIDRETEIDRFLRLSERMQALYGAPTDAGILVLDEGSLRHYNYPVRDGEPDREVLRAWASGYDETHETCVFLELYGRIDLQLLLSEYPEEGENAERSDVVLHLCDSSVPERIVISEHDDVGDDPFEGRDGNFPARTQAE